LYESVFVKGSASLDEASSLSEPFFTLNEGLF
jgi:hypothetical protein